MIEWWVFFKHCLVLLYFSQDFLDINMYTPSATLAFSTFHSFRFSLKTAWPRHHSRFWVALTIVWKFISTPDSILTVKTTESYWSMSLFSKVVCLWLKVSMFRGREQADKVWEGRTGLFFYIVEIQKGLIAFFKVVLIKYVWKIKVMQSWSCINSPAEHMIKLIDRCAVL